MNLILPRGSSYTGNYNDMDISLIYILLRNICGITPHSNGWGNDPDPTDRSLSAIIERIRIARNQCVHSSSPALSNSDFNAVWSSVRSTVVDFDSFLNNGNHYEREVDFLRHETMDPVRDRRYKEELRRQAEEDAATREIVHGLKHSDTTQSNSDNENIVRKSAGKNMYDNMNSNCDITEGNGVIYDIPRKMFDNVNSKHDVTKENQILYDTQRKTLSGMPNTQDAIQSELDDIAETNYDVADTESRDIRHGISNHDVTTLLDEIAELS